MAEKRTRGRSPDEVDFESALDRVKSEAELRTEISKKIEAIKSWVLEHGEKIDINIKAYEENPDTAEHDAHDNSRSSFWDEEETGHNGHHNGELIHTLIENGEEEHEYHISQYHGFIPRRLHAIVNAVPEDVETLKLTDGRELTIELATPQRTLLLSVFGEDIDTEEKEDDPYINPEKAVAIKTSFHGKGMDPVESYLPQTGLSSLTHDQAVITRGILDIFANNFINQPRTT